METYGDLKKAIRNIQLKKKGEKVGKVALDVILGAIPGLSAAKSTFDVVSSAFRKPDTKKSNSWLDKLDIDDEMEAIVDDTVENGFLKMQSKVFDSEPDDKKLESDFNMNAKMVNYLKNTYKQRTITGISEQKLVFDKFFTKFAYKFDKGYPDMNNTQDVLLLESLISEVIGEKFSLEENEGRVDTTLSAAITELPPALAFNDGYKPSSVEDFKDFVKNHSLNSKAFVNSGDKQSAKNIFDTMEEVLSPKMLDEKFQNAIGITNWLYNLNSKNPIDYVVWGYRAKPEGVPSGHAGDIFIFFKDGSIVGVSLKAGTEKSSEPLLNSFVTTQLNAMGKEDFLPTLYQEMWDRVYSKIPGIKNIEGVNASNYFSKAYKKAVVDLYVQFYLEDETEANDLYREMLNVNREVVIDAINSLSLEEFKEWVSNSFNLQKEQEIPLILVKAVGNSASQKSDILASTLGSIKSFKAVMDDSSVQGFYIIIEGATGEELKLKMTIRSDKSVKPGRPPSNVGRLGQMGMLKFQYSGIK
jgi:hypothetical protein